MKVTITSIELKGALHFFLFANHVFKIVEELKTANYIEFRRNGHWKKFYTMTLWDNDLDMRAFAKSGAHLEAMKRSKKIAKEIRTYTYDAEELPSWDEARILLNKAKVIRY
ncbi:DUF3291 domain-containing protein [Flavobacterium sp.]|uniref:DUF3291 domain-containing protein n=1 Tax=Flavobacterium sp. TaxID=239 RepID=UPI00286D3A8E|nr:DUF3291 domain-containing protein [Flavobacterium sp.]